MKQGFLLDRKMFSLTPIHHKRKEIEKIVKVAKSCFSHLGNQSTSNRSLTIEKDTHCLFIIIKVHRREVLL